MRPPTRLSTHALERARTRLHLITPAEIIDLLDQDRAVPLGVGKVRKRGLRVFRLFYSVRDNDWFVAVQAQDGMVVSIIPFNWTPWQIDPMALQQAEQLVVGPVPSVSTAPETDHEPPVTRPVEQLSPYQSGPQHFQLHCTRWNKCGMIDLGSIPARKYGYSVEALVADHAFRPMVEERIARRFRKTVKEVVISLGSPGMHGKTTRMAWWKKS